MLWGFGNLPALLVVLLWSKVRNPKTLYNPKPKTLSPLNPKPKTLHPGVSFSTGATFEGLGCMGLQKELGEEQWLAIQPFQPETA